MQAMCSFIQDLGIAVERGQANLDARGFPSRIFDDFLNGLTAIAPPGLKGLEEQHAGDRTERWSQGQEHHGFLGVFCRRAEMSEVIAIAGVSEAAVHEQFQSKDLVSAFLKDRHVTWMRRFENEIEARYEATGGGLEIIADILQEGFEDPKCFGFAFINIVTEGDDFANEPFAIARKEKEHLRQCIEQLAVKMGIQHQDMAASAAVLVIETTIVRTLMTGSLKEAQTARLLFQCLQHA